MLQTWNNFCFTTGYIEVAMTFPGPNSEAHGYVSNFPFGSRRSAIAVGSTSICGYHFSLRVSVTSVLTLFVVARCMDNGQPW